MDELAAGFVGLGMALRGVGRAGRLVERDDSGVEDRCCVDVVGVGRGLLKEPGRANAGAGVSLGIDAGVGSCEGFLFNVGSLDKRGMPRGMPVGLEDVCE